MVFCEIWDWLLGSILCCYGGIFPMKCLTFALRQDYFSYLSTFVSLDGRECKLTSLTIHPIKKQLPSAICCYCAHCRWKLFFDWANGKRCQLIFPNITGCTSSLIRIIVQSKTEFKAFHWKYATIATENTP